MTVRARALAALALTTGEPDPVPCEACTGKGTAPSSVRRERILTVLSIADRETTSPSRSIRITFRRVEIRWWATQAGSAVGRWEGEIGAKEERECEVPLAEGFGFVEKRMTWWKKSESPRSKTAGIPLEGFVQTLSCRSGSGERDICRAKLTKGMGETHEVFEHVSQFAHAGNVILPDVPDPVEEQLARRRRRNVFACGGTRARLTGTGRSDRVGGLREHGDDLFARLGLEVGRDEFGNSVVEEVALQRHTVRVVRDSGTLSLPYVAPCSTGLAYLFVQDEVVSVAVVFFERELRNVVPLDLLNRLLQPVERRINRFGLLRIVIPWSAFKTSPFSRTSAP